MNGVRTAADPASRGRGVLLLLNDEIQAAREVTKTSNWRMQTFRTPDFGVLGHADADRIAYYRSPSAGTIPTPSSTSAASTALPRVDIVYAYPGSDGTAVRAFVAAGARASSRRASRRARRARRRRGPEQAVQRRDVGGVVHPRRQRPDVPEQPRPIAGFLSADNLNPQKARLLLALALTRTSDPARIARMFATY